MKAFADKFGCRITLWRFLAPFAERNGWREVKR